MLPKEGREIQISADEREQERIADKEEEKREVKMHVMSVYEEERREGRGKKKKENKKKYV